MARNNLRVILINEGIRETELARRANLSAQTVARVASQTKSVAPVTRTKILKGLNGFSARTKHYTFQDVFPEEAKEQVSKKKGQRGSKKTQSEAGNKRRTVEISISEPFSKFSRADQERLLDAISRLLETSDVKIVKKRKGSVKLTLEVTADLAQQLLEAANSGKLQELSVSGAKLVSSTKLLEDIAFVIMRFGDEQLDSTYQLVIRQVLLDFGYSPLRIDEVQDSGRITDQILSSILIAKIVVADFTGGRPNCYYEAGFAHALKKPIIFTIKRGEKIHFDLSGYRFIQWKTDMDLRQQLTQRLIALRDASKKPRQRKAKRR